MNRAFVPVILLTIVCFASPVFGQQTSEYQVKAAFLFNFTKFMDWPAAAFTDPDEPFVVGVLGKDPFGKYLDDVIAGEKIMDRNMSVQRYDNVDEIGNCQILFVNLPGRTTDVISRLKGRSVLTVGDEPGFSAKGGVIEFYDDNGTVRFQINTVAAREASLNVSSKLLRIAKIVESDTAQ